VPGGLYWQLLLCTAGRWYPESQMHVMAAKLGLQWCRLVQTISMHRSLSDSSLLLFAVLCLCLFRQLFHCRLVLHGSLLAAEMYRLRGPAVRLCILAHILDAWRPGSKTSGSFYVLEVSTQ
jgi:hypothetical protein